MKHPLWLSLFSLTKGRGELPRSSAQAAELSKVGQFGEEDSPNRKALY